MANDRIGFWERMGRIAQEGADAFIPGDAYNYGQGRWDRNVAITGGAQAAGNHLAGPIGGVIGGMIGNKAQGLPWNANMSFFGMNGPRYYNGVHMQDIPYTPNAYPGYGSGPADMNLDIGRVGSPNVGGLQAGRPSIGPGGQVNYGGLQGLMSQNAPSMQSLGYNPTATYNGVTAYGIPSNGQTQVQDMNLGIQKLPSPQVNTGGYQEAGISGHRMGQSGAGGTDWLMDYGSGSRLKRK